MPNANPEKSGSRPSLLGRLWKWIDQRTGADRILRQSLDEPIPGGARFAYVFGSALLFIFFSQIVTGICLALYYVPSPLTAHASVAYIVKEVAAGSFLRSLHSYGSTAMLVVLLLHFLQTLLYGSYKGKRELLWIAGCTLALLVLGMTFTGYLLSWDQSGYSAGSVGTDIVGEVPFIGNYLRMLMRGGAMMGALTLSRFYLLHVLIIPGLILSFIAIHIFLFRKAGAAGPATADPVKPKLPTQTFYPTQVLIDMTFVLVVMGVLGMLAHFVPVMLGPEANPANTRYIPRPEWYFLPMFQWLKYWQGWSTVIGAFIVPAILIGLLFLLPFLDRGLERRPWRRPIPVGGVFIVLIGLLWLGLTSRLEDSRNPIVAAQLAEQDQQEHLYFYSAFQPYSASPPSDGVAPTSTGSTLVAEGKGIFDSQGCSGCHGESGRGAIGPSLTHITTKYPPARLTALLKAPTAKMTTAGMVPLTLNDDEMKALVSYLASFGGTSVASAAAPSPSGSAAPSKAPTGRSAGDATTAQGKAIFDSQRCSGCHGASGGGGVGPALTHISSQYPPAKLTALLKAPTAKMKAAGMVPLTLSAADMEALVSYVSSLGGTSTPSAVVPPASGSAPPAPANAEPTAAAEPSKAPTGSSAAVPTVAGGKAIFDSQRCSGCHGASGGGGVGPALTNISSQYPPAQLTALLKAPTAKMTTAGMVPLTLNAADIKALVAYVGSLGGASADSAAAPAAAESSPPAPTKVELAAAAPRSKEESKGQAIFKTYECAFCHGPNGVGGTARGPALAGTGKTLVPAFLTTILTHPTAAMQKGRMPPVNLSGGELKALVAYLSFISASKSNPQ
jgi:ubiquinol-cytochrome c reductase cytochrome b subunit